MKADRAWTTRATASGPRSGRSGGERCTISGRMRRGDGDVYGVFAPGRSGGPDAACRCGGHRELTYPVLATSVEGLLAHVVDVSDRRGFRGGPRRRRACARCFDRRPPSSGTAAAGSTWRERRRTCASTRERVSGAGGEPECRKHAIGGLRRDTVALPRHAKRNPSAEVTFMLCGREGASRGRAVHCQTLVACAARGSLGMCSYATQLPAQKRSSAASASSSTNFQWLRPCEFATPTASRRTKALTAAGGTPVRISSSITVRRSLISFDCLNRVVVAQV